LKTFIFILATLQRMLFLFDLNINSMQVYRFFADIQNEKKKSLE